MSNAVTARWLLANCWLIALHQSCTLLLWNINVHTQSFYNTSESQGLETKNQVCATYQLLSLEWSVVWPSDHIMAWKTIRPHAIFSNTVWLGRPIRPHDVAISHFQQQYWLERQLYGHPMPIVFCCSCVQELYVEPYTSIHWPSQRSNVAAIDIYTPHTKILDLTLG